MKAQPRPAGSPSPPFDLRALEIFVAVCNARSMSRAAALLGITQGAVSQQIAKLEANLGLRLVARGGRDLGLLPAGTNLLFHARRILEDVRLCEQSLQRFSGFSYPDVSLGIINTMSKLLSAPLIDTLDGVVENIHLHTSVSTRHPEEMQADRIDILVSAQYFDPDFYEIYPVSSEPLILLSPAEVPTGRGVEGLARLAQTLPVARFSGKRRIGELSGAYLRRKGIVITRAMEFDQTATLMDLVRRQAGWAIVTPYCLFDADLRLDGLTIRPLPAPTPWRVINVVTKRGRFAELPALLAGRCRAHLAGVVLPRLASLLPAECLPVIGAHAGEDP